MIISQCIKNSKTQRRIHYFHVDINIAKEKAVTLEKETFFLYNINSARTIDGVTAILDI